MEFTAYAAFIFLGASATVNGVALPFLIEQFSLPLSTAGSLFMLHSFGYLVASTFYPSAAKVTGNRLLLVLASLAMTVTHLGLPLMPYWWAVILAAFLNGNASSTIDVGLNAAVAGIPGERGTAALNWLHFAFGVGALISPFVWAQAINWQGAWQWAYWFCAVPFLPLAVAFAKSALLRGDAPDEAPPSHEKASANIYREGQFWLLVALMTIYCGIEVALMGWTTTYLTAEFGLPVDTASVGVSLMWLGLAVGRGICGKFSSLFEPRGTLLVLFPATAVVLAATAALQSPWLALASFFAAGLGLSAIFPMLMLNGTQANPYARVQVAGGLVTAAGFGALVFPWILGYVGEFVNLRWGILLLAGMSLAAGIATVRLPKPQM